MGYRGVGFADPSLYIQFLQAGGHAPSLEDQIRDYNKFDILVTMVGAHLANLVFTNRTSVAILEVGLHNRDPFHKKKQTLKRQVFSTTTTNMQAILPTKTVMTRKKWTHDVTSIRTTVRR